MSNCISKLSGEEIRRIIDGKSGITRIPNSRDYYQNGKLIKIEPEEVKNIFKSIAKIFKTCRKIKSVLKRNADLERALNALWTAKMEKDKNGKTERYKFYKVVGWDLTKQVLKGKI